MEGAKNILVTGASQGIGREVVRSLALEHRCNVYALSRNESALESLAAESDLIHAIAIDITDASQRDTAYTYLREVSDRLDGLVNNAGYLVNSELSQISSEDIHRIFEVNVFAPMELIRKFESLLRNSDDPHIVNIGSMGGYQGSKKFPGLSVYSSSKSALACLSECLAEEMQGVKSNCLNLGAVKTEMLAQAFPGYEAPVSAEKMGKYIADFVLNGHQLYNGQSLAVSFSAP